MTNKPPSILETLSVNFLIKDSPAAVAIVDHNMNFISHSDVWLAEFGRGFKTIIGKSYYEVLPDIPIEFVEIFELCLRGKSDINKGRKFTHPNGRLQWLKWKINPWKQDDGSIGGLIVIMEDVTAEQRMEELLLRAEQVAQIGGWKVDLLTNKVYWTDITKAIHEVSKDYVPNLEEGINFYKEGDHRDKITQLVSEAISKGTPWDAELQVVTAKGREVWVRAIGETEFIDGKCVRMFGTIQDIDDKKKAEIEYQKTNERLLLAAEATGFGVWEFDIATQRTMWDANMFKVYDIDPEDFDSDLNFWKRMVFPEDLARMEKNVDIVIEKGGTYKDYFWVKNPKGKILYIRTHGLAVQNESGLTVRLIGTAENLTEYKNTQLQLTKTEESLQGTFENSSIGMALVGLDGQWTKVNDSICKSVGYSRDELLKLTFQDITHPEDLDKDLTLLEEVIEGKRDSYQIEKRYYHKKGHIVYVLLTVTAVKKINGDLSHFISQIVDLSSRIEAEKKLTKLLDVSSEQNNSLMNFAHIVSHNLRSHSSNLSMLTGFLEKEKSETERQNIFGMLKQASNSLNETVHHLNEVVHVKASAHEKMRNINLYETLKGVEQNICVLLKEKEATCKIAIPKKQTLRAIPAYLDSILLNLFTNSLKYSHPDRPPLIQINSEELEDKILVTFKDNGLGIDLKKHGTKLFGMYKTFHRNKDAKGIGLFITKNQIEAMNGSIEVESTVDVGTTFKLFFEKN